MLVAGACHIAALHPGGNHHGWHTEAHANGECFQQPSSERTTCGAESSLWPTILASEAEHGGPSQRDSRGKPTLTAMARQIWATPQAQDSKSGQVQQGYTQNLTHQVHRWTTQTAIDAGSGRVNTSLGENAQPRPTLARRVREEKWPTPAARDYRSGMSAEVQRQGTPPLTDIVKGRLNPCWVEALMGFPIGWTDLTIDGQPDQGGSNTSGSRRE